MKKKYIKIMEYIDNIVSVIGLALLGPITIFLILSAIAIVSVTIRYGALCIAYITNDELTREEAIAYLKENNTKVEKGFEVSCRNVDYYAFTERGVIQSFEILYDRTIWTTTYIAQVPAIINQDKELYITMEIDIDTTNDKLIWNGDTPSGALFDLSQEENLQEILKEHTEVKKYFYDLCRRIDHKAFTEEGAIQSLEIDYNEVLGNLKDLITITGIINNDQKKQIHVDFEFRDEKFKQILFIFGSSEMLKFIEENGLQKGEFNNEY